MSQNEFKQCPNGHYYQGDHCPYCQQRGNGAMFDEKTIANNPAPQMRSNKTQIFGGETVPCGGSASETVGTNSFGEERGTMPIQPQNQPANPINVAPRGSRPSNHTVIGGPIPNQYPASAPQAAQTPQPIPNGRKLVGWLVSYTNNPLGEDYKLYEGRNTIGRGSDCNLMINDGSISGHHATIVFRANKFSLKDEQSSNGSFVNGEDIELEATYIKDGDSIRLGNVEFKIKSSL